MTLRQKIGITLGVTGILINVVHFALFFISDKPERYHEHGWIVGFGLILTLGGLLLLLDKKQAR